MESSRQIVTESTKAGAPSARQKLYDVVCAHEGASEALSILDISQRSGVEYSVVARHVRRLIQIKVLRKSSVRDIDYAVNISSTTYNHGIPLEKRSPETQAFYTALQQLGLGTTSVERIIQEAKAANPAIDADSLRVMTRQRLIAGTAPKNIQLVTEREQGRKRTSIQFDPEVQEGMHSLVEGLTALRQGDDLVLNAQRCREIMSDKDTFTALFAKGAESSQIRKQPYEATKGNIVEAVAEYPDGLSVRNALSALRQQYPSKPWSEQTVRDVLEMLVEEGRLGRRAARRHSLTKQINNVYYLIDEAPENGDQK